MPKSQSESANTYHLLLLQRGVSIFLKKQKKITAIFLILSIINLHKLCAKNTHCGGKEKKKLVYAVTTYWYIGYTNDREMKEWKRYDEAYVTRPDKRR